MSTKLKSRPVQPPLPYHLSWSQEDYQTLAQFIIGVDGARYKNYWAMVSKLAMTLQELELLRAGHEQRLAFFIGNRVCYLGDWQATYLERDHD